MNRILTALLSVTLFACPALADDADADAYVEANLLSIFYHELGHALIDVLSLPVLGQEEDAADTASILLIDALYEEDTAQDIAALAAFGFLDEAAASGGDTPVWWDEHGPDLQRYYNLVCLFYGADPDARADLAEDLELPQERAERCPEEFDLAAESWGAAFDDIETSTPGQTLAFEGGAGSLTGELIGQEVAALNRSIALPGDVLVRVEPCGEANAYYDPGDQSITMCSELEEHLRELYSQNL